MKEIAFDNDKYLKLQSKHILDRISKFDKDVYKRQIQDFTNACPNYSMLI